MHTSPVLSVMLMTTMAAAQEPSCAAPAWHTVFDLDPAVGCPGDWVQTLPSNSSSSEPPVPVWSRGKTTSLAQVSAILFEGWSYSEIRGELVGHEMGTPDAFFRTENWRGERTLDDAYVDGVSIARWGSHNRVHVATYATGLSYVPSQISRGYKVNSRGGRAVPLL